MAAWSVVPRARGHSLRPAVIPRGEYLFESPGVGSDPFPASPEIHLPLELNLLEESSFGSGRFLGIMGIHVMVQEGTCCLASVLGICRLRDAGSYLPDGSKGEVPLLTISYSIPMTLKLLTHTVSMAIYYVQNTEDERIVLHKPGCSRMCMCHFRYRSML